MCLFVPQLLRNGKPKRAEIFPEMIPLVMSIKKFTALKVFFFFTPKRQTQAS